VSTPNNRPLWEVMEDALSDACRAAFPCAVSPRKRNAAMLRAIADEVVPETMEPVNTLPWVGSPNWMRWDQRMEIRGLLLAEAELAEATR